MKLLLTLATLGAVLVLFEALLNEPRTRVAHATAQHHRALDCATDTECRCTLDCLESAP